LWETNPPRDIFSSKKKKRHWNWNYSGGPGRGKPSNRKTANICPVVWKRVRRKGKRPTIIKKKTIPKYGGNGKRKVYGVGVDGPSR